MIKFQISNFQFPISNKKFSRNEKGFTLIELLVVMIAFMVTGTVIASVIFTHVKAIDKTGTETTIRQTGNGIISQMSKDIRNAGMIKLKEHTADPDTSIVGVQLCDNLKNYEVLYTTPTINSTREISYQCSPFVSSTPPILPNIRQYVGKNGLTESSEFLVDTNYIVVSNCKFTCQVTPGALPVITIKFTLEEKTTSGIKSKSIGEKVSIPFNTSVQMRNY